MRRICITNLDKKETTCSIFLDLAKAFDTVNHEILIAKLEKYGVRGNPQQLIRKYLTNRKQYTEVNGTKSKSLPVTGGVSQGLTLGPSLILIHVNDLPKTSQFQIRLFADDTTLTFSHKNIIKLNCIVNTELKHIDNCMKINKLFINLLYQDQICVNY